MQQIMLIKLRAATTTRVVSVKPWQHYQKSQLNYVVCSLENSTYLTLRAQFSSHNLPGEGEWCKITHIPFFSFVISKWHDPNSNAFVSLNKCSWTKKNTY